MQELATLTNVSKSYGKKQALKELNLTIPSGKIIGLLGPNGSGKTTIIKLLNGLLQPSQGTILIDGLAPSAKTKAEVSYLPDKTYLNEYQTIQGCLNFFKDFYSDFRTDVALKLLQDLNLNPSERLKSLSKGNKEKVQLILVMSRQAKLYLLDEPIGGVDPAARDYILQTIISQYSEEASVVISTHLISDIEPVLDEIIFLKDGEINLQGNADDIRESNGKSIDKLFREVYHN